MRYRNNGWNLVGVGDMPLSCAEAYLGTKLTDRPLYQVTATH